jgi:PAS domain S-box-containing protein
MRTIHGSWRNLPLRGKGLVVVALPILALVGVVIWSYQAQRAEGRAGSQLNYQLKTLGAAAQVLFLTVDSETGVRGYLLTGQPAYLDPYHSAQANLGPAMKQLGALVQNQPAQRARVQGLQSLLDQRQQIMDATLASHPSAIPVSGREADLVTQGKAVQDAIRAQIGSVMAEPARQLQAGQSVANQTRSRRTVTILGGAALGIVAALVALGLFSSGVVRRIRLLQENARRLASGDELAALPPGKDEVGRLGEELEETAKLLRDSREQLKVVFEAGQMVIWEYDQPTGALSWPATQYEAESSRELIEQRPTTLEGVLGSIVAEDRPRVAEAFATVGGRGVVDVEFRAVVGAETHWFTSRGRLRAASKDEGKAVGFVLDITDLKAAEQAVRESEAHNAAILASIADGVVICDPRGEIVSINPAMEVLTGWSRCDVVGEPFDFFPMLDDKNRPIDRENQLLARTLATREPVATRGYGQSIVCKDGRMVPLAGSAAPIIDDEGKLLGAVEVLRDVTYDREVDRLKSSLVSTVSHELRTPLTMIQGFSELILSRRPSPEKEQEALRHINTSAQRLARLIDDLLTVSRIESGRAELRAVPIDLGEIVGEMVAEFAQRRHVDVDRDPDLPPVLADRDMLVQILTNLLSNAAKYSPPGTPVRLAATREGDLANIAVSDEGVGMSEAEKSHLFERFFRAQRAEVQNAGGTGLGLYITKSLVELHGGHMWVESELGVGSTFGFFLPLAVLGEKGEAS